jgi:hypothetical protein
MSSQKVTHIHHCFLAKHEYRARQYFTSDG